MKRKPKIGDTKKIFGLTFTWTGSCWRNNYIQPYRKPHNPYPGCGYPKRNVL